MRTLLVAILLAFSANPCSTMPGIWIPHSPNAAPLFRFIKDGKAGYINSQGEIAIPATMDPREAGEFVDGLSSSGMGEGRFWDTKGNFAFDAKVTRAWSFSDGLAAAMPKGGNLWGFIDTQGNFAISPRFATYPDGYVFPFSEGLAKIDVNGKAGFIDKTGNFVIAPNLLDASSFHDGMARVVLEGPCAYVPDGPCGFANIKTVGLSQRDRFKLSANALCRFTYIDRSGAMLSSSRFDGARDFSEGLAAVRVGALWGFIDRRGDFKIAPQFEEAEPFSSGLSRIRVKGKFGYANTNGEVVIPAQFELAKDFMDGLAVVADRFRHYSYINKQGEAAFPGKFRDASPFFKGLAHVQLMGDPKEIPTFAYIDRNGHEVFRY